MISGATGEGVQQMKQRLLAILQEERTTEAAIPVQRRVPVLRPKERDRLDLTEEEGVFVVRSPRAEEEAKKLGEGGDEALEELQERLRRMGLEKLMRRAGARPGDAVRVGNVEIEWQG
jgi:GTP-binding protein